MNKTQFKNRLSIGQSDLPSVGDVLHRRIMRAVASASTEHRLRRSFGFVPALAAGTMALVAAILIWNLDRQVPARPPIPELVNESQAGVEKINQRIASLGGEVRLPEAALRKELQRLESDLKRFRLSS